jgi:hypothetical protein
MSGHVGSSAVTGGVAGCELRQHLAAKSKRWTGAALPEYWCASDLLAGVRFQSCIPSPATAVYWVCDVRMGRPMWRFMGAHPKLTLNLPTQTWCLWLPFQFENPLWYHSLLLPCTTWEGWTDLGPISAFLGLLLWARNLLLVSHLQVGKAHTQRQPKVGLELDLSNPHCVPNLLVCCPCKAPHWPAVSSSLLPPSLLGAHTLTVQ